MNVHPKPVISSDVPRKGPGRRLEHYHSHPPQARSDLRNSVAWCLRS